MKDNVMPEDKWKFDQDVTDVFDNMLERSIVQYDVMRDLCFNLGKNFVKKDSDIVDLGASTGEAINPFIEKFGAYNRFHCIEVSESMIEKLKNRFDGYTNTGIVSIKNLDLRNDFPCVQASLILSILTIQFIPIEYRQNIIQKVYDNLLPNGAFIFVEKILGNSAEIDSIFIEKYYDIKKKNGYSQEQIERKRLSLEGVLVPITSKWNEDLLKTVGFKKVDCFWRFLNFSGWIAIK